MGNEYRLVAASIPLLLEPFLLCRRFITTCDMLFGAFWCVVLLEGSFSLILSFTHNGFIFGCSACYNYVLPFKTLVRTWRERICSKTRIFTMNKN